MIRKYIVKVRAQNLNSTTVATNETDFYPTMLQQMNEKHTSRFLLSSVGGPHFSPITVPNQIFFTIWLKTKNKSGFIVCIYICW